MISLQTVRFPVFVGSDGARTTVQAVVTRQARGESGVFDYAVTIDGERRGIFVNDNGIYRLQDVARRNVRGVPVVIGEREFEPAVIAALRAGRLPTMAQAMARVPSDPNADRERIANAVRVLDSFAHVELAGVPDEVLITEANGISVGQIRSLLDGYAHCHRALMLSV